MAKRQPGLNLDCQHQKKHGDRSGRQSKVLLLAYQTPGRTEKQEMAKRIRKDYREQGDGLAQQ